jgi:uncharacterized protein (TIGR02466 family)
MIENWFSTPIYFVYADKDFESIQQEISNKINAIEDQSCNTWAEKINTTFDDDKNDIYFFQLKHLQKFIIEHVNLYAEHCGYNGYTPVISKSWTNFNNPNDFQFSHSHDNDKAIISGTYYYKTNQNDGDIVFETPNILMEAKKFPSRSSFDTVQYSPEIGKLLLFPSWLKHKVQPNQTQDTRISISFNIEWSKLYE